MSKMTAVTSSNICTAQLEYIGVIFLRFPWHLRLWFFLLACGNLAGTILCPWTVEVYSVALVFALCHFVMSYIYQHHGGFTRLIGLGHAPWLILVPWLVTRVLAMDGVNDDSGLTLKIWLWVVVLLNSVSLLVDALNVYAYMQGETERTYYWREVYYDFVDDAAIAAAEHFDGDQSDSYYSTLSI